MPLVSVPAVYDGNQVRLLEKAHVEQPYRVLVTFLEPADEHGISARDMARFWSSFGAWQDDRPIDDMLRDIHESRHSKKGPPAL